MLSDLEDGTKYAMTKNSTIVITPDIINNFLRLSRVCKVFMESKVKSLKGNLLFDFRQNLKLLIQYQDYSIPNPDLRNLCEHH